MTHFWKPMPYYYFRDKDTLSLFKRNDISTGIAAMKIYILICLTSNSDESGNYCSSLTYDQISKYASLSRKLISSGFKKLDKLGLLAFEGKKKKRYYLIGVKRTGNVFLEGRFKQSHGYWAKLPYIGLVDSAGRITAFESMSNRSLVELNSLKLFVYLLSIRSKDDASINVTLAKISSKLGISFQDAMLAISFMQSIGMLYKVNLGDNTISNYDAAFSIKFLVCGWERLEWKPNYLSHDEWKDKMLVNMFPER